MKWINDVVFAILAAHVWGSLMLFVWLQAVKKLSKRGYSRALFWLLRCVVVAYLLPFGFCLLIAVDGYFRGWDGRLFEWTPIITVVNHTLFIAWLIGLERMACNKSVFKRCISSGSKKSGAFSRGL